MNKKYSSFSQSKGLLWRKWYDAILQGQFKPPVGAVIDLTDKCNLGCGWCNAQAFRSKNTLDTKQVLQIVDDLKDWGVLSVCYAGGGEPTLHKDFAKIVDYSFGKGLEVGVSMNGTCLDVKKIQSLADHARFCGVSFDAGTEETWKLLKRGKDWNDLLKWSNRLGELAENTILDYSFKFLLVPENQNEILLACKLAKSLRFKNFYVRPAAFERVSGLNRFNPTFNVERVEDQLFQCLREETDTFKVYSSFNRVDQEFRRIHSFSRCSTTPLMAVYCADGYCYLCIDHRGAPKFRLSNHSELRHFWNSPKHHLAISNVDLNDCPRCAFGNYNEQIECYAKDFMFWKFP